MSKCKLDSCDNASDKNVELNAEDFTRWEFHIRGPFYYFCSKDHREHWVQDNSQYMPEYLNQLSCIIILEGA